jgi:hypothetical protein
MLSFPDSPMQLSRFFAGCTDAPTSINMEMSDQRVQLPFNHFKNPLTIQVNIFFGNERRLESSAEHVRSHHPSEFILMLLHVVVLTWLDGG